jgi:hypothetical protein
MNTYDGRLSNWILRDNLKQFLTSTTSELGISFNDDDWETIRYGIQGSSDAEDRWFEYEFRGAQQSLKISLANDEGGLTDLIFIKIARGLDSIAMAKIQKLISDYDS